MKKTKRFFLRIPYYLYWFWTVLIYDVNPINFNAWLSRHGFWRLTNHLDNLKFIVPKEYRDFVKKYPNPISYMSLDEASKRHPAKNMFHWYENGEVHNGSEGILAQIQKNGENVSYTSENKVRIDDIIKNLKNEKGPTELPPE